MIRFAREGAGVDAASSVWPGRVFLQQAMQQCLQFCVFGADDGFTSPDQEIQMRALISRPKLTYANVVATLALFMALGGGAYAATTLPAKSVGANQLKSNAVTQAKIKNSSVTTPKVAAEAITTEKLGSSVVTSTKLGDGAVLTGNISKAAVTAEKLADEAVGTDQLGRAAVTTAKLGSGVVTAEQLGRGSVTTEKLAAGAVATDQLGGEAVTGAKLGVEAVTAAKLAGKSVTADKLADSPYTLEGSISAPVGYSQHAIDCPAGTRMLSGGILNSNPELSLLASWPENEKEWGVGVYNNSGSPIKYSMVVNCLQ